jgi:hypothetical protein
MGSFAESNSKEIRTFKWNENLFGFLDPKYDTDTTTFRNVGNSLPIDKA